MNTKDYGVQLDIYWSLADLCLNTKDYGVQLDIYWSLADLCFNLG